MQGVYGKVVIAGDVASKQYLDRTETQSFIREVYSLLLLRNTPQVIQLQSFHFQDRRLELEVGQKTLTALIQQQQQSESWGTSMEAKSLLWQLVVGLKAVNDQGVWHRDIKPDNIVLVGNVLKLIDFGLAKIDAYQSVEGTNPVYTYWWRAPELLVANVLGLQYHQYDGVAAEIYAIGAVFLCILLGNDHGLLQATTEQKQLEELCQMDDARWDLMNSSVLDQYELNWRERLGRKLRYSKNRYSFQERVLACQASVTMDALELLKGLLHPDVQKRYGYSQILQHAFFDTLRCPVLETVRPSSQPLCWTEPTSEYLQLLKQVSATATTLEMQVPSKLFMLALIRSQVAKAEVVNWPLLGYSCLFVADALYSHQPTSLKRLAKLGQVNSLEKGIQQVLTGISDAAFVHPSFESLFSAWQIEASHPQYPELLHCYFVLEVYGVSVAVLAQMCILIVRPTD